jgi:putative hemolysin
VSEVQHIDIKRLIASKSPRLAKWLPRFVLRYLKRVLHQDEINYVLSSFRTPGLPFLRDLIQHLNISYTVEGAENLQPNGRYLFACNHPLGGLDGVVIMDAIGKIFPNIKFVVNDLLYFLDPLKPLFLPINKHGGQSAEAAQMLRSALNSDEQILYFPAGLCSREIKGEIVDLPWKTSFLKMAISHQRYVVPMFFEGRNSSWFYSLANLRKWLGVKANVEQFYLADELFRQRNGKFTLRIGQPISYELLNKDRNLRKWVNFVREKTYELQHCHCGLDPQSSN